MKIDINNYEAFFLDFAEGRLDDASTLEMLAFLRKHPHLKAELESFADVRLEPADIPFKDKNVLKRFDFSASSVSLNNFDDFCIAYFEKLLTKAEEEKLFSYLKQFPDKEKDFRLFGKTTLKADPAIVFEAKPFLKKKQKGLVRTVILRWTAVAAGVVLIVSVFYKYSEKEQPNLPTNVIAHIEEKVEVNPSNIINSNAQPPRTYSKSNPIVSMIPQDPSPSFEERIERVSPLPLLTPIQAKISEGEKNTELGLLASTESYNKTEVQEDFEVLDYAEKMLREKILKTDESKPKKKFSLWDLADITLKGYNSIAEKDIILHRKTDENGKLTTIAIETENNKYGFETKN